jgi:uncharacterized protein YceK
MKRARSLLIVMMAVLPLAGCASIVNGTHQNVSVDTGKVTGARCTLSNNKGKWYIPSTPGSTVVNRSYNDLRVSCHKSRFRGFKRVESKTKGMVFGNAVIGGVIGAGVDVADGAAYDYPDNIYVPLHKKA